jgi:protein-S-isoprenylcysteine O-methyltransferase Ste14
MTLNLKTAETPEARANRVPWPPILLIVAIAVPVFLGRSLPLGWPGLDDGPARFIGRAFGLAGFAVAIWAVLTLRRHHTTVMPHGRSEALVTSGPYAWTRNPIYLGEALMLLGIAELTKNVWFVIAAAAFAITITALQILAEERHLEARFEGAYRDYKSRTRRWI